MPTSLQSDVNFGKIAIKEDQCPSIVTGYFSWDVQGHAPTPEWVRMEGHEEEWGTLVEGDDNIVAGNRRGIPYKDGTNTWNIPWRYQINGQDKGVFAIAKHVKTLSVRNGVATLTIDKEGAKDSVSEP